MIRSTEVVGTGVDPAWVLAALMLPCFLLGLLVAWHIVRRQRPPADQSNRINKIRLIWYALTREDELARAIGWLQLDESTNVPIGGRK